MASQIFDLETIYRNYIAALNNTPTLSLASFVNEDVIHNDSFLTREGYQDMIAFHKDQIPDLHYNPTIVMAHGNMLAVRIEFNNITPIDGYLGYGNPDGKSISFCENVFYEFENGKINQMWSIVDEKSIERQLKL
jgi:predicted ester cyclase